MTRRAGKANSQTPPVPIRGSARVWRQGFLGCNARCLPRAGFQPPRLILAVEQLARQRPPARTASAAFVFLALLSDVHQEMTVFWERRQTG